MPVAQVTLNCSGALGLNCLPPVLATGTGNMSNREGEMKASGIGGIVGKVLCAAQAIEGAEIRPSQAHVPSEIRYWPAQETRVEMRMLWEEVLRHTLRRAEPNSRSDNVNEASKSPF